MQPEYNSSISGLMRYAFQTSRMPPSLPGQAMRTQHTKRRSCTRDARDRPAPGCAGAWVRHHAPLRNALCEMQNGQRGCGVNGRFSPPQELVPPNNNAPNLKGGDAKEGGLGGNCGGGGGISQRGKGSGPPLQRAAVCGWPVPGSPAPPRAAGNAARGETGTRKRQGTGQRVAAWP